ncbi:MAG: hypothetical protein KKF65_01100, partial [Nanoarchaeota archaeon]|nr:hypothetical protein [Nanoarchaeota archaeon]
MKTLLKQNKPLLKEFVKWSNLFYLRNDEFYDRDFEHGLAFIVNEISKSNPESWKKEIYDLMRKAVELTNGLYKNFLVSKALDLESKKLRYNEPTSIKTAINRDEFYEDRQVRLQQNQFSIEQGVPVDTSFSIVDPFIPEWCNIICKPDHFYNLEFLEKSVKQIFKDKKLLETKPKAKMLQNIHELYSRHSFNPESNYWQTMRGIIELFVMSIEEESFVSKFDQINLLQQQYLILDNYNNQANGTFAGTPGGAQQSPDFTVTFTLNAT